MKLICLLSGMIPAIAFGQLHWKNVDSNYQPLPASVHVYYTDDLMDGKPNHAYYVTADLSDKHSVFTASATNGKRSTPTEFYQRESAPLLVMNATFFEFVHNTNVSLVMQDGRQSAYSAATIARKGKDTLTYYHPVTGAIGINKKDRLMWPGF